MLMLVVCSCSDNKQPADLSWYKGQVIEQVVQEDTATYRIQIGIMAAAFWLKKENKHFEKDLALLQESLAHKKKLDIGVEKGTSKIRTITETK